MYNVYSESLKCEPAQRLIKLIEASQRHMAMFPYLNSPLLREAQSRILLIKELTR